MTTRNGYTIGALEKWGRNLLTDVGSARNLGRDMLGFAEGWKQDRRSARKRQQDRDYQIQQMQRRINELTATLNSIDNWLVCYAIATPEDFAQAAPDMHEKIEAVLGPRNDGIDG